MKEEEKKREEERRKKKYGNNRDFGGAGGEGGEVARTSPPILQKIAKMIAVNDLGLAIGESHPRAVLTNHEVDLLLELRAEGLSYGRLAVIFEVHKGTVAKICSGQRRAQFAVAFRRARGPG